MWFKLKLVYKSNLLQNIFKEFPIKKEGRIIYIKRPSSLPDTLSNSSKYVECLVPSV